MKLLATLYKQWTDQHGSEEETCRRTRRLSVAEGGLNGIAKGAGEFYIVPFALFLQAGNYAMGFLGVVPQLVTAIAQMAGVSLTDRTGRRRIIVLIGSLFQGLLYLPVFVLPVFLPVGNVAALLVCVALYFSVEGIILPAWMSMMGDVVHEDRRGRFFSIRTRALTVGLVLSRLLAGLLAGILARKGLAVLGFGIFFFCAALSRFAGAILIGRHYDAPYQPDSEKAPFTFSSFIRGRTLPNFSRFALSVALLSGCSNIAGPFMAVYMLRDLEWSYLLFTVNVTAFMLTKALFVRWWGRVGDRYGNRVVLTCCSWLIPVLPVFWVVSRDYAVLLYAQVLSGMVWAGFELAVSNFIYDSVPQARRARAQGYYGLLAGLASLFGGIVIGAGLAEYAPSAFTVGDRQILFVSSLPVVFLVSILMRAVATVVLVPRFREVRDVEHISPWRILWWLVSMKYLRDKLFRRNL